MLEGRVGETGRRSTGMDQHCTAQHSKPVRAASLGPSPSDTDRGPLSDVCLRDRLLGIAAVFIK